MKRARYHLYLIMMISIILVTLGGGAVLAQNIDPSSIGCQYAWGENVGWINFKPSLGTGVTVTNTAVTGMAWGENIGWINLSPTYGGVVNDGQGNLSGYAWGENVGWINFKPENGGVIIGINGMFSGYAWGENVGWINFSPTDSCLQTAWLPPAPSGECGPNATFVGTPVVSYASFTVNRYTVSFTDTSTDPNTGVTPLITVNWRDGNVSYGPMGTAFSHTYTKASTYAIYDTLTDCISSGARTTISASVPVKLTISGIVTSSTGTPVTGATVVLKFNGHTRAIVTSEGGGSFTFSNVIPYATGSYTLGAYEKGYTFSNPALTLGTISTSQTVTIKPATP